MVEISTIEAITNVITSVGFPIAVCLICFWYIYKINEQHKEEVKGMQDAINNNTLVMQQNTLVMEQLVSKIGEK